MIGNTSNSTSVALRPQVTEPKGQAAAAGRERALTCARAALDKKAENVRILELREISTFTDYFVIASAMSERQVQAIADSVLNALAKEGVKPVSAEGYEESRWVLLDFGDVVVHVFLDPLREYYGLETLWASAPRVPVPSSFYGGNSATRID